MIKLASKSLIFGALMYSGMAIAEQEVKIIEFITEEIEVCNKAFECEDIPANTLPSPREVTLLVESYDQNEGYIMFKVENKEMWVHITEVELNKKAVASVVCTAQTISSKSDKSTYATLGLGEGCN